MFHLVPLLFSFALAQDELEAATKAVPKSAGTLRVGDTIHVEGSYVPGPNCPDETPVHVQVFDGANWHTKHTTSSSGSSSPNIRFDYTAKVTGTHRVWVEPKIVATGCNFQASLAVTKTSAANEEEGEE